MVDKYTSKQTTGKNGVSVWNSLKQGAMLTQKILELIKVEKEFYHIFIFEASENIKLSSFNPKIS